MLATMGRSAAMVEVRTMAELGAASGEGGPREERY